MSLPLNIFRLENMGNGSSSTDDAEMAQGTGYASRQMESQAVSQAAHVTTVFTETSVPRSWRSGCTE